MTLAGAAAYQIVQVRPVGYVHADAISDLVDAAHHGMRRLGLPVRRDGEPIAGERQIIFGAHLADAATASAFAPGAVIYNTEQMTAESSWFGSDYLNLLRRHPVWDYSERNVFRLRELGVSNVRHVPVGFVPELVRVAPAAAEDIDILFYGSLNRRRQCVLEELAGRGLKVVHLFGKYGSERDGAIARAKIVLSIHYYESRILEIVRVSYLLNNMKAVVAECGPGTEVEPDVRDAVRGVPYEDLVEASVALLRDDSARQRLARQDYVAHKLASTRFDAPMPSLRDQVAHAKLMEIVQSVDSILPKKGWSGAENAPESHVPNRGEPLNAVAIADSASGFITA